MSELESPMFSNRLIISDDLSEKQIQAIRNTFNLVHDEIIDSFIDDTLSKNGRKGILFTNRGIHWKLIMEKGFLRYCDINDWNSQQKKKSVHLILNDKKLEMIVSEFDQSVIAHHLKECLAKYKEESRDFTPENKKVKKQTTADINLFTRIFIIELPYILFILGIFDYLEYSIVDSIDAVVYLSVGITLLLLTLPYRIKKAIDRKRVGKSRISSLILHATVILFLIIWKIAKISETETSYTSQNSSNNQTSNPRNESSSNKTTINNGTPISTSKSNTQNEKYYCKHCGHSFSNLNSLTANHCSNSPTKKHQPFEGSISPPFFCEHCGHRFPNLISLTANHCSNSPTKKHQPFEGSNTPPFICKHCGHRYPNLTSLTANSCSNSPTKKHQPMR